jgi:Dolichyl-phosphate-mannose-protein mannosyltransferase
VKGASTPPPGEALEERGERAWFVGFVVVAALLVRALYLLSIRDAPFFLHLQTEPARYDAWAQGIVRGVAPFHPPLDEAPAYPYFVAAVYACVGHRVVAVAALQAALDACSAGAVALVARRVLGARAGWVAGVLYAAYGPLVYFTGQLEPATLGVLAVSIALACTPTGRGDDAASLRAWSWAGVAWAAALLVRSEMLFALPVVAFAAARAGGRPAALRAIAAPAVLLAASLTLNAASSGHVVLLTTGSGVNLWIGNNPSADGVSPFLHGTMLVTAHDVEARARDAVEADALFRGHAWAFVRGEPARALHLLVRRLVWLFGDRELPNSADIAWQTAQSWLFAWLPAFPLRFGPVFAVALAGLVLRAKELRRAVVLAAPVAVAVAVAALFFTNARFRLVMSPSLLVLAAGGVDGAIDAARARGALARDDDTKRLLLRSGMALLVGALVAFSGFEGLNSYRIDEIDQNTRAIGVRAPAP